jgi:hypothetical protein
MMDEKRIADATKEDNEAEDWKTVSRIDEESGTTISS